MLRRKFAVIKLWPGVKAAEDEVIERVKIAAQSLDLECVVVDPCARLINPPNTQLTQADVDFVLSLHFERPKQFDIFSFVTLWNPLQFYHEWGYRKFTRHLLTHDDFLSCDSVSGDDHVRRFVSGYRGREGPLFRFYPSVAEPILEPTLGDRRLFYAGMNWEKLNKKAGRHDGLFTLLDRDGDLRIYGPKTYLNADVWEGYRSYVGPIPFDGVSVIRLINQAGISLVLSSDAHCDSEMMSSRIFESSAAGAVIICNENPFARRHFGDSLLYIDTTLPPQDTYRQIQSHLVWIKAEPQKALELARQSQCVFRDKFRLDSCLERIYEGLPARKTTLECAYTPKRREERICVIFLAPEYDSDVLERHISSFESQKNITLRGVLALDARDAHPLQTRAIRSRISELSSPLELAPVQFFERRADGSARRRKRIGEVLSEVINSIVQDDEDYICVVAPEERLFSDHLCSLVRALQDVPEAGCAWSDMLEADPAKGADRVNLCDDPNVHLANNPPIGFGRFLFRLSALQERLYAALPYLDTLAMHLLFGMSQSEPTRRSTLLVAAARGSQETIVAPDLEREILLDLAPVVFQKKPPDQPLLELTDRERLSLATQLAHSFPLPAWLERMIFGVYRFWLRSAGPLKNKS